MIYLDCNATTPVAAGVLEEMLPVFTGEFANPSSTYHAAGRRAADLVHHARERVAACLGANPGRVVFTSGSTEALNLAIKGLDPPAGRNRILVGATEHKAVLEAAGSSLDNVVKTTCFLQDLADFAAFNAVYSQSFTSEPPARSTVQVAKLPREVLVEVEAVALLPE